MNTMEPLAYLHLQLGLEGLRIINGCFIQQFAIVPDEGVPLILIVQPANGELVRYYDEAISPDLQRQLSTTEIKFLQIDPLLDVLKSHNTQAETAHYKTYVFPSQPATDANVLCLSRHDWRINAFGFDRFAEQIYATEENGILVSACVSVREDETCGEAWVYTVPEYRRHGFAQKAVRAWARSLMEAGKVPFYSHSLKNEASANLARRLGLLPVFEEISIMQVRN